MERKKAIFFDWDGTLSVGRFWQQLENPSHVNHKILSNIEETLFRENKDLVRSWMVGQVTTEQVCTNISQILDVDIDLIIKELEISCRSMELVSPTVLDVIDKLRKEFIVAIATDNMDTFTRWTVPSLELNGHFDGVLNSFDLKTSKRDAYNFFHGFLEEHKIDPINCTIIDDSEDKDAAISTYGFNYVKIQRGELMLTLKQLS